MLPQRSVKVQVRVIVPPQAPPTRAPSVPATDPAGSQLSVYPRLVIAGTSAAQATVTAAGAAAKTGATKS